MLKQWIEVEGHIVLNLKTLTLKTQRISSHTNEPCVYFTVVIRIFTVLGHQTYSNAHSHNNRDGILYPAESTIME